MNPVSFAQRFTAAEMLAYCVLDLFPGALLLEGDATKEGFFYDFVISQPIDDQIISLLEENFRTLSKSNSPIKILEMMRENAAQLFRHQKQSLKSELVARDENNVVSVLKMGTFHDMTTAALLPSTDNLGSAKILKIEKIPSEYDVYEGEIVRIQGILQSNPQALKKFIKLYDSHAEVDHRLLGKEMRLFAWDEAISKNLFWLPRGVQFLDELLNWWREAIIKQGFKIVQLPPREEALTSFIKLQSREAGDLPKRWAQKIFTEQSTTRALYGLLDHPAFYQDLLTIYCTPEQVKGELISSLQFFEETLKIFGFEKQWILVANKASQAGITRSSWEAAKQLLKEALKACDLPLLEEEGKEALEGPYLELLVRDSLGRDWPLSNLRINLKLPEGCKLRIPGSLGEAKMPFLLQGSLAGSFDRLAALLLENSKGSLPFWVTPEQVRVLCMGKQYASYAEEVFQVLEKGFRTTLELSETALGAKVHLAEREKVPYMVIIGNKEQQSGLVTVRSSNKKEEFSLIKLEDFLKKVTRELQESKKLESTKT